MGYYSQNPHYLPEDYSGDVALLEAAEVEAGKWFDYATKPQAARYAEQMAVASAYRGAPKWDRIRDAAKKEFAATTTEAAALCDETVQHYIAHGEVLEELADRWEALAAKTNATAAPIAQAAE